MKRSLAIKLLLIPTVIFTACDEKDCSSSDTTSDSTAVEVKHCVNDEGTVVDDTHCKELHEVDGGEVDDAGNPVFVEPAPPPNDDHTGSYGPPAPRFYMYRWYYGGTNVISPGTRVGGGSYSPRVGISYGSPSVISRGGFGSIGRGIGVGAGA